MKNDVFGKQALQEENFKKDVYFMKYSNSMFLTLRFYIQETILKLILVLNQFLLLNMVIKLYITFENLTNSNNVNQKHLQLL